MNHKKIIIGLILILLQMACKKEKGCTDIAALNYDKNAQIDDCSCMFNAQLTFYYNGVNKDSIFITNNDVKYVTINGVNTNITNILPQTITVNLLHNKSMPANISITSKSNIITNTIQTTIGAGETKTLFLSYKNKLLTINF